VIEPGTFPTAKVVGGYDFVGDAYNGASTNTDTPVPDPDPLDCAGHGSHVAGIAAGLGVLANGATFNGPYTNGMDFSQFQIGPGVAPRAQLYALKVFGCSGSTEDGVLISALEWAADPNGDTNFVDRLDVVNMSLGSSFGLTGPDIPIQEAVNQLADLGCVVVISAGNSGETFYIVGKPSTAEKAISVAASIDDATTTLAIQVLAPPSAAGYMNAVEGAFTRSLAQSGPIQTDAYWAQPANACSSILNPDELFGHIAIINRGTCNFTDKIQRAQDAGAIGVIMVNNVAGAPTSMGGTSSTIHIPGVMISQADGQKLFQAGIASVRMAGDLGIAHPELRDQLADFSSRGPASPGSMLKPEIAAPGFTITSVKVGGGTLGTDMSGTSMAAPHVTGAAALLRQLHPDWSSEEIKAALMNTARATHDAGQNAYPESRTGAGRVQIDDAAKVTVTAKAENSGGLVSLSFGALILTNTYTESRNIILSNHSAGAVSYSVVVSNTVGENGVTLTAGITNVTVPANGSALVPVQFNADPLQFDRTADPTTTNLIGTRTRYVLYETSGEIWFQNTNLSVHVPYYANVRAASAFLAGLKSKTVPLASTPVTLTFPLGGFSTHPQPLVSAFQLGATSTNQFLTNANATADLLAVGAATDAPIQSQFGNSTVYFGIGVAAPWATPQHEEAEFDVLIDTNSDGMADFTVFNWSLGNSVGGESDVFETGLVSSSFLNSFVNGFSASQRDTAPHNNNVIVLPMTVAALGLGPGHSQIRYQVKSYGPQTLGGEPIDQTDWITFDTARPVLDTVSAGLSGKPFFADGTSVTVTADLSATSANGAISPSHIGLLLLHHFNTPGNRIETVDLQFAPQFLPPQIQGNNLLLSWSSASNAVYTLQYATNLNQGFVFVASAGIGATPPLNTLSVTNGAQAMRFYRLKQD
jgi:subtilisin family serine protease